MGGFYNWEIVDDGDVYFVYIIWTMKNYQAVNNSEITFLVMNERLIWCLDLMWTFRYYLIIYQLFTL